jgi:hypothetical protein
MSQQKRKKGGQRGNRNALKNGIYSVSLDTGRKRLLAQAVGLDEINRQIRDVSRDIKILLQTLPAESVPVARAFTCLAILVSLRSKLQNLYRRSAYIMNITAAIGRVDFNLESREIVLKR